MAFWCNCGEAEAPTEPPPIAVTAPLPEQARLAVGDGFSCFIVPDGSVRCWGREPGMTGETLRAPHIALGLSGVHQLIARDDALCARTHDRRVLCRGARFAPEDDPGHIVELASLSGARTIAMDDSRVCGIVSRRLTCEGQNLPPLGIDVGEQAWLAALDSRMCVLDGRSPLRCVGRNETALTPIVGTDGANSLASARGTCITTSLGALVCAAAQELTDFVPVPGVSGARLVAGAPTLRCVVEAERVRCDHAPEMGAPELVLDEAIDAIAISNERDFWHACVVRAGAVRCWGNDRTGETGAPFDDALVHRVEGVPPARAFAISEAALFVVDETGTVQRRPWTVTTSSPQPQFSGPVRAVARCGPRDAMCALTDDRLLLDTSGRVETVERFAARGPLLDLHPYLCAASEAERAVCIELGNLGDGVTTYEHLAQPAMYEGDLCGLRSGRVECVNFPLAHDLFRHETDPDAPPRVATRARLAGAPSRIARLFGGYEQLFLELDDGTLHVLGHNGVGQLGLSPSRPVERAALAPTRHFERMVFDDHISCGWSSTGAVECAGVDATLSPRQVAYEPGLLLPDILRALADGRIEGERAVDRLTAPTIESHTAARGDGSWTVIPTVADVVQVDTWRGRTCALDRSGAIHCWGAVEAVVFAPNTQPRPIALE